MLTLLGIVVFVAGVAIVALGVDDLSRARRVATLIPSKVRALRRGIVAVEGQVRARTTLSGPLTRSPCAWYRMSVVARHDGGEQLLEEHVSNELFTIEDETGRVLVDPVGVQVALKRRYHEEDRARGQVTSEWRLDEGQRVLFVGTARTMRDIARERSRTLVRRLRAVQADRARLAPFEIDARGALTEAGRDALLAYLRRELRADEPAVALGASDLVIAHGHASDPFVVTDERRPALPRRSPVRGVAYSAAGVVTACLGLVLLLA